MTDSGPTVRRISIGAFAIWLLLIAIQYDYLPGLGSVWALHLLRYLPSWLGWLLAGLALLVTTEEMRRGLIALAGVIGRRIAPVSAPMRELLLFAVAVAALWLLRERHLFGLSKPLLLMLGADEPPARILIGAELLLRGCLRGALQLGLSPGSTAQLMSSVLGAGTIVILSRAARAIAEGPQRVLIPLLVFSAGLLRVCVGRIDLQPPVLAAAAAVLLLAIEEIRKGDRLRAAAIATGIAASLQPICFFLFPGLLLLAAFPKRSTSVRTRLQRAGVAMGWAWAPILAYAIGMSQFAVGDAGIAETLAVMGGVDARSFALLSFPSFRALQLTYLANSAFVLAPAAPALLLAFVFAAPRRLYTDPIAAFLAVSCASLTFGASIGHSGFGSLEWDKFAVTALFLAVFAGHLLSGIRGHVVRGQLAAALVGMQALFVGVPLVCLGFDSAPNAGPLSKKAFSNWAPDPGSPPADSSAPQP